MTAIVALLDDGNTNCRLAWPWSCWVSLQSCAGWFCLFGLVAAMATKPGRALQLRVAQDDVVVIFRQLVVPGKQWRLHACSMFIVRNNDRLESEILECLQCQRGSQLSTLWQSHQTPHSHLEENWHSDYPKTRTWYVCRFVYVLLLLLLFLVSFFTFN